MSLRIAPLPADPEAPFPAVESALPEPDGLLAFGGDLTPARLVNAYRHGIFPWYSEGEPILWWSPSVRAVFRTDGVHLSSRFKRSLRKSRLVVRADTCFDRVIAACARAPRPGQAGTWITPAMQRAYVELYALGHAHSIEVFDDEAPDGDCLVGGLYGVVVGRMFCGESMFSTCPGASSLGLAALARRLQAWDWPWLDAQVPNDHTRRLGVETWSRNDYIEVLHALSEVPEPLGTWTARFGEIRARELATQVPA